MITIRLWKKIHLILDRFILVYENMNHYNSDSNMDSVIAHLEATAEIIESVITEIELRNKVKYSPPEDINMETNIKVDIGRITTEEEAHNLSSVISYFNYLFSHYTVLLKNTGMSNFNGQILDKFSDNYGFTGYTKIVHFHKDFTNVGIAKYMAFGEEKMQLVDMLIRPINDLS